jgi:hypothetical protein
MLFIEYSKLAHYISVLLVLLSIVDCLNNPLLCISKKINWKRDGGPDRKKKRRKKADDDEKKRKADEDKAKKADEDARKKAEEDARKKADEDARKKAEEDARKKAEEDARKAEEDARKKAEEDARKKAEADKARLDAESRKGAKNVNQISQEADKISQDTKSKSPSPGDLDRSVNTSENVKQISQEAGKISQDTTSKAAEAEAKAAADKAAADKAAADKAAADKAAADKAAADKAAADKAAADKAVAEAEAKAAADKARLDAESRQGAKNVNQISQEAGKISQDTTSKSQSAAGDLGDRSVNTSENVKQISQEADKISQDTNSKSQSAAGDLGDRSVNTSENVKQISQEADKISQDTNSKSQSAAGDLGDRSVNTSENVKQISQEADKISQDTNSKSQSAAGDLGDRSVNTSENVKQISQEAGKISKGAGQAAETATENAKAAEAKAKAAAEAKAKAAAEKARLDAESRKGAKNVKQISGEAGKISKGAGGAVETANKKAGVGPKSTQGAKNVNQISGEARKISKNSGGAVGTANQKVSVAPKSVEQRTRTVSDPLLADKIVQQTDIISEKGMKYLTERPRSIPLSDAEIDKQANKLSPAVLERVVIPVQKLVNDATNSYRNKTDLNAYDSITVKADKTAQRLGTGYSGQRDKDGKLPADTPDPKVQQEAVNKMYKLTKDATGNQSIDNNADVKLTELDENSKSVSFYEKIGDGLNLIDSFDSLDADRRLTADNSGKSFAMRYNLSKKFTNVAELFYLVEYDSNTFKWEKYETDIEGNKVKAKTLGSAKLGQFRYNMTKYANFTGDVFGVVMIGFDLKESIQAGAPAGEIIADLAKEFGMMAAMNAAAPVGMAILYTLATPVAIGLAQLRGIPLNQMKWVTFKTGIGRGASTGVVSAGRNIAQKITGSATQKIASSAAQRVAASGTQQAIQKIGTQAVLKKLAPSLATRLGGAFIAASVIPVVNFFVAIAMFAWTIFSIFQMFDPGAAERARREAERNRQNEEKRLQNLQFQRDRAEYEVAVKEAQRNYERAITEIDVIQKRSYDNIAASTEALEVTINASLANNLFLILQRKARVPKYQINADGVVPSGSADPSFILHNYVGIYNLVDNVYDFYYWKELSSTDFIKIANDDNSSGTYAYSVTVQNKIVLYLYDNCYWSNDAMDANSDLSPTDPNYNPLIPTREQYYRILNMQNTYGNDINIKMIKYYHDDYGFWNSVVFSPINVNKSYYFPTNYELIPDLKDIKPAYSVPIITTTNDVTSIINNSTNSPTYNYPYYFQSADLEIQLRPLFDTFYQKFIMVSGMPKLVPKSDGTTPKYFDFTKPNTTNIYKVVYNSDFKDDSGAVIVKKGDTLSFNTYINPDPNYSINETTYPSSNLQNPYVLVSLAAKLISSLPAIDNDVLLQIDNLFLPIFIDFCNSAYNILSPKTEINVQNVYGLFITDIVEHVKNKDTTVKEVKPGGVETTDNIVNKKYIINCHCFQDQGEYNNLFKIIDQFYKNMLNDPRIPDFHYPISIDTLLNYSYMFYFLGFHNTFVPSSVFNTPINTRDGGIPNTGGLPSNNGLNKDGPYTDYTQQPLFTKPTIEGSMVDETGMIRSLNELDKINSLIYGVVTDISLQNKKGEPDLAYFKDKYLWNRDSATEEKLKRADNFINVLYGLNRNNGSDTYIPAYYRPVTKNITNKGQTYKIYDINYYSASPGQAIFSSNDFHFYPTKPDLICGVPVYDSIINKEDPKKPKVSPPGNSESSINYTTKNNMMINNHLLRNWLLSNKAEPQLAYLTTLSEINTDWVKAGRDPANIMNVGTILNVMQLYATVLTSMLYNDTGFAMNLFGFFHNMRGYYLNVFNISKNGTRGSYGTYADLWFAAALGYTVPFIPKEQTITNTASSSITNTASSSITNTKTELDLQISILQTKNFNLLNSNAISLYFTVSGTLFDYPVDTVNIIKTTADIKDRQGKLMSISIAGFSTPIFYTGISNGTIDYITSVAIQIPRCAGFSVDKGTNSVTFYQFGADDYPQTVKVKQDSSVLFSCLSLFPIADDGENLFSRSTGRSVYINNTFVSFLQSLVKDIKPYYLPATLLFEKRVKYSILEGNGRYINDSNINEFINPFDPGLNRVHWSAPFLQNEVLQIVRIFNKYILPADPLSDYRHYLTRKPNTQVTQEELNAYARMAYINTYLLFYVHYYRNPATQVPFFDLEKKEPWYRQYWQTPEWLDYYEYSYDYKEEWGRPASHKLHLRHRNPKEYTTDIVSRNLLTNTGFCTVNHSYSVYGSQNNFFEFSILPITPNPIPLTGASHVVTQFFEYFINVDYYEDIVGRFQNEYLGPRGEVQLANPMANDIYAPGHICRYHDRADYENLPVNFYYIINPTKYKYINKIDYGPHFNYNNGPTRNYTINGREYKNHYVNFSKFITSFSVNETDSSVKFYKGQLRMYKDDKVQNNTIYVLGSGQYLHQNPSDFNKAYFKIFNPDINLDKTTLHTVVTSNDSRHRDPFNWMYDYNSFYQRINLTSDYKRKYNIDFPMNTGIRFASSGGLIYTPMPVNIHIYEFDDPYYNYEDNPLYKKMDAKIIDPDVSCIVPRTLTGLKKGNDTYNLFYIQKVADSINSGGYFCTGFLYDLDNPNNTKFYRNKSNTPSPLFSGSIAFNGEIIPATTISFTPMEIMPLNPYYVNTKNLVFYDRGYNSYTESNKGTFIQECLYMPGNLYPSALKIRLLRAPPPPQDIILISVAEINKRNKDGLYQTYVGGSVKSALIGITNTYTLVLVLIYNDMSCVYVNDPALKFPTRSEMPPHMWWASNRDIFTRDEYNFVQIVQLNAGDYGLIAFSKKTQQTIFLVVNSIFTTVGNEVPFHTWAFMCLEGYNLCNPYVIQTDDTNSDFWYSIYFTNYSPTDVFDRFEVLKGYKDTRDSLKSPRYYPITYYIYNLRHIPWMNYSKSGKLKALQPVDFLRTGYDNHKPTNTYPDFSPSLLVSDSNKNLFITFCNKIAGYNAFTKGEMYYVPNVENGESSIPEHRSKEQNVPDKLMRSLMVSTDYLYYISTTAPGKFTPGNGYRQLLFSNNLNGYIALRDDTYTCTGRIIDDIPGQKNKLLIGTGGLETLKPSVFKPINVTFLLGDTAPGPIEPSKPATGRTIDGVIFSQEEDQLLLDLQLAYVNLNINMSTHKQSVNMTFNLAVQDWLNAYKLVLQLINCKTTLLSGSHSREINISSSQNNKYTCKGGKKGSNYYNLLNLYPSITNISTIWKTTDFKSGNWEPFSNLDATNIDDSNKKLFFTQIIQVTSFYYGINVYDNQIYVIGNKNTNNTWFLISLKYNLDSVGSYYLPKDPGDQTKHLTAVSISYDTVAQTFVCVLSDGNIWTSSVITFYNWHKVNITWTKNTSSGDHIFITYINGGFYAIKTDNNIYYYSAMTTPIKKLSTTGDFIFLAYNPAAGGEYIKINTSGNYFISKGNVGTTSGTPQTIWDWNVLRNHGYNFTNIIAVSGGFLAIGTRPANELSSRIMIEANDQVLAKNYGEALLNNSTTLLYNGTIRPNNIGNSNQEKYFFDRIESDDINTSTEQGNALALSQQLLLIEVHPGEQLYTSPRGLSVSYTFTVPVGVTSICILCIGGAGGPWKNCAQGNSSWFGGSSTSPIVTAPGTVICYAGGGSGTNISAGNGTEWFGNNTTAPIPIRQYSGAVTFAGGPSAIGGGGGGAAGYAGVGGAGGIIGSAAPPGGGGGGGSISRGGGGVGLYGQGISGGVNGGGGSGSGNSTTNGGQYGGGAPGGGGGALTYLNNYPVKPGQTFNVTVGNGGLFSGTTTSRGWSGAVRIIWGTGRSFPSTNVTKKYQTLN